MIRTFKKSISNLQGLSLALVMLFSLGQAMAFFKSCEMNSSDHKVHQSHQVEKINTDLDRSHDSMLENTMNQSQTMNSDCCDSNCICPQGSCSSVNLLSVIPNTQFIDINAHSGVISVNSFNLNKNSSSLYRPPISC